MNKVISNKYQESYIEETLPNGLKVVLWQKKGYEKSYFMMTTPLGALDIEQVVLRIRGMFFKNVADVY